ncbi:MAG: InlB B-repeat-containing protein [Bacilli bacterium]|nr:InlB B-repeat-containing protein [Bacilli bacterium]
MNKLFKCLSTAVLGGVMALGVGVGVASSKGVGEVKAAEQEYKKLDLTTKTSGTSNYNTSIGYGDWQIVNGANNNKGWTYFKMGGKNTTISSFNPCYIYYKKATEVAISKVKVHLPSGSLSKSGMKVNSWGVYVYSDQDMTNLIEYVSGGTITNGEGTFELVPSNGTSWTTGSYFKVSWDLANSTNTNGIVCVDTIVLYTQSDEPSTYKVTYYPNGADDGNVPVDSNEYNVNDEVVVLGNTGNLKKTGHTFSGWNTKADGTGTLYKENDTFNINEQTSLYAKWTPNQMILDYDTNGGTGDVPEIAEYDYGTKVEVFDGSELENGDLMFTGWNTSKGGEGTSYTPGEKITMDDDYTLYAQWAKKPVGFELVTDSTTLSAGDKIIFGCKNSNVAAGLLDGTYLKSVSANFSGNTLSSPDALVFTLGGTEGAWTFSTNSGTLGVTEVKKLSFINGTTTFTVSISTEGTATVTSTTSGYGTMRYNSGSPRFTTYASGQADIQLYRDPSAGRELTSISSVTADVSLTTGDEDWTIENAVVMGRYSDSTEDEDVTAKCDVSVSTPIPTFTETKKYTVTLVAKSKSDAKITKSNPNIQAQLTYIDTHSIRYIYENKVSGENVEFDGIYTGFTRDGAIFMNGKYGMKVLTHPGKDCVSDPYVKNTAYTITGKFNINNKNEVFIGDSGKQSVKDFAVSELKDNIRLSKIESPETYIINGSESSSDIDLSNRKTNATGIITSLAETQSGGNYNATIDVSGKSIQIFIAAVFAKDDVINKLQKSKDESAEITIEGYTGIYSPNFQIALTNLVEAVLDYTATDFAQDLLILTDAVCDGYDGKTNNKEALQLVWSDLNSGEYYLKLSSVEKEIFKNASITGGQTLNLGAERYDYLVAKYGLGDFADRNPSPISGVNPLVSLNNIQETTWIIVIVGLVSLTAVGGYFFIHRRKED